MFVEIGLLKAAFYLRWPFSFVASRFLINKQSYNFPAKDVFFIGQDFFCINLGLSNKAFGKNIGASHTIRIHAAFY